MLCAVWLTACRQGTKQEFLALFFPRPPADEDIETLHRTTLERAFQEPFWQTFTNFVRDELYVLCMHARRCGRHVR